MVAHNTASRSSEGTGKGASAGQGMEPLHEKAGQAVEQAQEKAGQLVDAAKQQTTSRLEDQRERVATGFYTTAHALRQTGQQLREQDQEPLATLTEKVAEQAERGAGYLRGRDVPQLLAETEQLGRAHPMLFAGGALALGVLGARFLKSSRRTPQATTAPLQLPPVPMPAPRTPAAALDRDLARESVRGDTDAAAPTAPRSSADHAPVAQSGAAVTSAYTPHGTGFQAVEDVVQQIREADEG